jgi:hypothetical protein
MALSIHHAQRDWRGIMRKKENRKSAVLEHSVRARKMPTAVKEQKPAVTPSAKAIATLAAPNPICQVSEADIRLCAYQKWEAAGKPKENDIRFWLQAEQELKTAM